MKRTIVSVILAALFATTLLNGCGQAPKEASNKNKISIVTTIFAPYDFSRAVARDLADVAMLLPPASESHSFEPTPKDIKAIQNCDVFIYVGGESDHWVKEILASIDTSKISIITLMDCVETLKEEIVAGMQEDKNSDEENAAAYDEHVWTSPRNAKLIVEKISKALCDKDNQNAEIYINNVSYYLEQLDGLDLAFQEVISGAKRNTIVFGDRFPFRYFTDAYRLDYFAAFPGCANETEASAATVAFLIDKVKAEKIPVVFHIELGNVKMANTIAEATGAKVLELHSCHNISKADFDSQKTYLDLMNGNVAAIKEALR